MLPKSISSIVEFAKAYCAIVLTFVKYASSLKVLIIVLLLIAVPIGLQPNRDGV